LDIFEISNKKGKKIRLTNFGWKHISHDHPDVSLEEIKSAIINPIKIKASKYNPEQVFWYYQFNKIRQKYLMVSVRYLNGDGFIITAYYLRNLK